MGSTVAAGLDRKRHPRRDSVAGPACAAALMCAVGGTGAAFRAAPGAGCGAVRRAPVLRAPAPHFSAKRALRSFRRQAGEDSALLDQPSQTTMQDDDLVAEINELARSSQDHHSATAIAAAAASAAAAAAPAGRNGRPEQSKRRRAARKTFKPVLTLPGDTLEIQPAMVAHVTAAVAVTVAVLVSSARASPGPTAAAVCAGAVMAELFSGCFHWATDNYGSLDTPVVGFACAAFQGHHLAPWTIHFRPTINNVYKIARPLVPLTLLAGWLLPPGWSAFAATTFFGQMLAQEFHRWSHTPTTKLAPWQRWMQSHGIAMTTAEHCRHHRPPFAAQYCILNGMLNPLLDSRPVLFWRRLESFFFRLTGVEPNCWKGEKGAAIRDVAMSL